MKHPIEARPTSCDKAKFSTAPKELRDNPLFEHLMRTCSTFSNARKTLAYVLRFVNNTRMKTKNRDPIPPKELTESELRLFKWCRQTIDLLEALDPTSKYQALTEDQWRTYLAEVTCLINQRPLYPSSNGIWESPPITLNDLLIGNHFPPPMPEVESKVNPRRLMRSTEKRVQELSSMP